MADKVKFYTKYNPPPSVGLSCKDASLTRQEFVQESDINNIMKRYAAGMPLPSGTRPPVFDDFSNVPDFQTAFNIVHSSMELFSELSSDVRERFANDPQQLLAFLNDEKNREEAISLGLLSKPVENPVVKSVSVPETDVKGEG